MTGKDRKGRITEKRSKQVEASSSEDKSKVKERKEREFGGETTVHFADASTDCNITLDILNYAQLSTNT